jgi:hypothetical protein
VKNECVLSQRRILLRFSVLNAFGLQDECYIILNNMCMLSYAVYYCLKIWQSFENCLCIEVTRVSDVEFLTLRVHKYVAAEATEQKGNPYQNKKYHITLLCHFNFYMTKTSKNMKV